MISSAQNSQLKLVRKLQRRRTREQEGLFVVEGEDLVAAGLETGHTLRTALVDAERLPAMSLPSELVLEVESKLLADVSELAHAPRVIGIFEARAPAGLQIGVAPILVLDAVADPGNVGTIIRTAAAFGVRDLVLLPGCADPYSGKAIRASMGSCFRVAMHDDASLARMREAAMRFVALDAGGDSSLADAQLDASTAIIVGGERDGVSEALLASADLVASIPQDPAVESLNAGVAASLALYEWARAR